MAEIGSSGAGPAATAETVKSMVEQLEFNASLSFETKRRVFGCLIQQLRAVSAVGVLSSMRSRAGEGDRLASAYASKCSKSIEGITVNAFVVDWAYLSPSSTSETAQPADNKVDSAAPQRAAKVTTPRRSAPPTPIRATSPKSSGRKTPRRAAELNGTRTAIDGSRLRDVLSPVARHVMSPLGGPNARTRASEAPTPPRPKASTTPVPPSSAPPPSRSPRPLRVQPPRAASGDVNPSPTISTRKLSKEHEELFQQFAEEFPTFDPATPARPPAQDAQATAVSSAAGGAASGSPDSEAKTPVFSRTRSAEALSVTPKAKQESSPFHQAFADAEREETELLTGKNASLSTSGEAQSRKFCWEEPSATKPSNLSSMPTMRLQKQEAKGGVAQAPPAFSAAETRKFSIAETQKFTAAATQKFTRFSASPDPLPRPSKIARAKAKKSKRRQTIGTSRISAVRKSMSNAPTISEASPNTTRMQRFEDNLKRLQIEAKKKKEKILKREKRVKANQRKLAAEREAKQRSMMARRAAKRRGMLHRRAVSLQKSVSETTPQVASSTLDFKAKLEAAMSKESVEDIFNTRSRVKANDEFTLD